ncbi:MAG: hypothetical protein GXO99_04770 [Nitrospirae bacterium]|nr:hypothetical protein [Nitrospirota bacterium]
MVKLRNLIMISLLIILFTYPKGYSYDQQGEPIYADAKARLNPNAPWSSGPLKVRLKNKLTVYFSAAESYDKDYVDGQWKNDSLEFTWDFGDGHTAAGENVVHTYTSIPSSSSSPFVVTLTANDVDGAGYQDDSPTEDTVEIIWLYITDIATDNPPWGTPFFPASNEKTRIYYTIVDRPEASPMNNVTIKIYSDISYSSIVRTFSTGDTDDAGNPIPGKIGENIIAWNGKDAKGKYPSSNVTYFIIEATNKDDQTISTLDTPLKISGVSANPSVFDPPNGKTTTISYSLTEDYSYIKGAYVTVRVYGPGYDLVKTLLNSSSLNPNSSYQISWNGRDDTGEFVDNGIYTCVIEAYDTEDNWAIAKGTTITVDMDFSKKIGLSLDAIVKATVFGLSNPGNTINIDDGLSPSTVTADTYGNYSGTISSEPGSRTVTITASDPSGKLSPITKTLSVFFNNITLTSISSDRIDPDLNESIDITYNLSVDDTIDGIIYGPVDDESMHPYYLEAVKTLIDNQSIQAGNNSITWDGKDTSGLTVADGTYLYVISSTNENVTQPIEITGAIVVNRATPGPSISGVTVSDINSSGGTVTWSTSTSADSQIEHASSDTMYPIYLTPLEPGLLSSHSVTLTGLSANTTYYYRVRSKDVDGNLTISPTYSFTTTGGPVISYVRDWSLTETSATIGWKTDLPADSQVNYGIDSNNLSDSQSDATLTTSHSITLNGLTPDVIYYYQVQSTDEDTLKTESQIYSFSTDTTSPTVSITSPSNGNIISGTKLIQAQAGDNVGIAKVEIWIESELKTTLTSPPYEYRWDTTTTTDGEYWIRVSATDASHNESDSSVKVKVHNDTTPPTVSITSPQDGETVEGTITITADATDDVGVTGVTFYIDNQETATVATAPYTYTWDTTTAKTTITTHQIMAKAYDAGGNEGISDAITVTIDNPLKGVVNLQGTSLDDNFDYYQVEYGAGSNPSSWTLIDGPYTWEANNALLAVW